MKKLLFLLLLFIATNSFSQNKKDTVFIFFDKTEFGMKRDCFKAFQSKKYPNEDIEKSFIYKINEKPHIDMELTDTGYSFDHYRLGKFDIERGAIQPLIIKKDISFLKKIKLLDINFFLTTDYNDVCKTFEAEDSWEQDVIIFIIDKDEIKNGKIIMREVTFNRPVKE